MRILAILIAAITAQDNTTAVPEEITQEFCWKPKYGRGIGKIPKACPAGKEAKNLLCHSPCKEGYIGVGFLCWKKCPDGYKNDGLFCRRPKPLHIMVKESYNRGIGTMRVCGPDLENRAGLCYKKCKPGYRGVGSVCWAECNGQLNHNCGASCAIDKRACINGVMSMGAAALELIGNIGVLVATAGASAAIQAGTKAVMEGVDTAVDVVDTAVDAAKVFKNIPMQELQTVKDEAASKIMEAGQDMSQEKAKELAEEVVGSGVRGSPIDWTILDPTGIASVVKAFKRPQCKVIP